MRPGSVRRPRPRVAGFVGYRSLETRAPRGRIVRMPPIRRILVLAVDGAESLDVVGPVEVFAYAGREVPGAYRIEVVGPGEDGWITMGNGLRLGVEPLPDPPPR